jgi:hypothetical protein
MYLTKFHDSHYHHPLEHIIYMSVNPTNPQMYTLDDGEKLFTHYKEPDRVINKNSLRKRIGYEEEEAIEFILDSHYQYYLFEDYFSVDMAKMFNKLINRIPDTKIFFWSDIRTNFAKELGQGEYPGDLDVIANNAMTYAWIKHLIKGRKFKLWSMLKFRCPFDEKEIQWNLIQNYLDEAKEAEFDFEQSFKETGNTHFFRGVIYVQAWAGVTSSETRLWSTLVDLNSALVEYDTHDYEDKCFAYNMLFRFARRFHNPYHDVVDGFDHCGDCSIEAWCWERFMHKYHPDIPRHIKMSKIYNAVFGIGAITGRSLTRYPHGQS